MERVQLAESRLEAATVQRSAGGLQRGDQRAFVFTRDNRVVHEFDALFDCFAPRDDAEVEVAVGLSLTVANGESNRVTAQSEASRHDWSAGRARIELAADFTTRMRRGMDINVP